MPPKLRPEDEDTIGRKMAMPALSYELLVRARKECCKCRDLVNPADPSYAQHDSDEVGPWSRWLASRPAKLVIVGQDWSTTDYFEKHQGRDILGNLTNDRLREHFLKRLGYEVGPPNATDTQSGVFATNAILCLKRGAVGEMSAPVRDGWFKNCQPWLRQTIEVVDAPMVIALGRRAYDAAVGAYGAYARALPFREAVEACSPVELVARRLLFAAFHPAARPVDRTFAKMQEDWDRIAAFMQRRAAGDPHYR